MSHVHVRCGRRPTDAATSYPYAGLASGTARGGLTPRPIITSTISREGAPAASAAHESSGEPGTGSSKERGKPMTGMWNGRERGAGALVPNSPASAPPLLPLATLSPKISISREAREVGFGGRAL
eukprot:scaffold169654_cov28-Tisochrysis_lutea.AAC.1